MKKPLVSDMARVEKMRDEDIDYSDSPPVTEAQIKRAIVRQGLKPVERKTRKTKQAA